MRAPQHAGMTADRWAAFTLDQQILMVANEMHRAGKLLGPDDAGTRLAPDDRERARSAYERVLRLTDLTIQVNARAALRRELLRWRDLAAALYVAPIPSVVEHRAALRCLLRFTPAASRQIPFVLGAPA